MSRDLKLFREKNFDAPFGIVSIRAVPSSVILTAEYFGKKALAQRAVEEGLCADISMVTDEELAEITNLLVNYGQYETSFLLRHRIGLKVLMGLG